MGGKSRRQQTAAMNKQTEMTKEQFERRKASATLFDSNTLLIQKILQI